MAPFEGNRPQDRLARLKQLGKPVVLKAAEAIPYGIDLSQQGVQDWQDWAVKLLPDQTEQGLTISYLTPDGYEIFQDETVLTPEGRRTTWQELIDQDDEDLGLFVETVFPEGLPEQPRPSEEFVGPMPQLEASRETLAQWVQDNPETFLERLRGIGQTPQAEAVLRQLAPDITDEDMAQVFSPYAVNVPAEGLRFDLQDMPGTRAEVLDLRGPAVMQANGEIRLETGEFVGVYNQETGQIEQPPPTSEEINANLVAFEEQRDTDPAFKRLWTAPADSGFLQEFNHADLANPFTAGVGDLVSSVGGAAKWMGLDGIGANLSDAGKFLQMQDPASFWQGPYTPGFYVNRVIRALPFAIAVLPAAILGGYAAAAGGAALGLGALGQTILGAAGGAALARPIESALEAGNTYDEAIRSGMDEQQASKAADSVFRKNMTLVGLDFAQFATAFMPIKGSSIFASRLFKVGRIAGMPVVEGLSEAGEEVVQGIFQRQALGQAIKWDPEMQVAAIVGGFMGVGLGVGGEVFTYMKMRIADALPAELKQQFDSTMQAQQAAGLILEEAELAALDEIAATPEGKAVIENVVQQMQREEAFNQVAPKTAEEQAAWERIADAALPEQGVAKPADAGPFEGPAVAEPMLDAIGKAIQTRASERAAKNLPDLFGRSSETILLRDVAKASGIAFHSDKFTGELWRLAKEGKIELGGSTGTKDYNLRVSIVTHGEHEGKWLSHVPVPERPNVDYSSFSDLRVLAPAEAPPITPALPGEQAPGQQQAGGIAHQLARPAKVTLPKGDYYYHYGAAEALPNIVQEGLQGGGMSSRSKGYVYALTESTPEFWENGIARDSTLNDDEWVILRFRSEGHDWLPDPEFAEEADRGKAVSTADVIAPDDIEVLTTDGWMPAARVQAAASPGAEEGVTGPPVPPEPPPAEPSEAPIPPDADSAIKRLVELVKNAKPVRAATEVLKSAELRRRVARAERLLATGEGREAFLRSTAALKGSLPKAEFEAPQSGLNPVQIIALVNYIRDSGELYFTKINTEEALQHVLMGEIPTRGEILLLEKMFGPELAAAILSKRTLGQKSWEAFVDTWNLPKAVLASWDFSAPLRQGAVLFAGQYGQSLPALKQMVQAAIKESNARATIDRIESSPYAELRRRAGLYIAPLFGEATRLSEREESFMTRWAHKIPGIKWSERAYITYLNVLRADVFDFYVARFERQGIEATEFDYQEIASFINHATGRGDLGKLEGSAAALNSLFFSPRLQASRVQVPLSLVSRSKLARQIAAKNIVASASMMIVTLGLLALAGATVEMDPRSTDFGKARIGNTRLDFAAGFLQYVRLIAQLTTGMRKTGTGKVIEINRLDNAIRFLRSKAAPSLGLFVDVLDGKTFVGEELDLQPATLKRQAYQRFVPLFVQDLADALAENGLLGGFLAAPAFLGVGAVTYKDAAERNILKLGQVGEDGEIYRSNNLWGYISSVTSEQTPEELAKQKNLSPHILSVVQARQNEQMLDRMKDTAEKKAGQQRNEWLRQHPAENAALAVWGQRKPLTRQAYDEALRLMDELAIPETARPKGFPPPEISAAFLAYNDAADRYDSGSAEAKLARLENPAFDAWGSDLYGWKALDDDIRVLRISAQYREQDEHYDKTLSTAKAKGYAEQAAALKARADYLEANPGYRDDRRRRDAYRAGAPDNIVENFVEYYRLSSDTERRVYRIKHPDFEQWGQENLDWKPVKSSKGVGGFR